RASSPTVDAGTAITFTASGINPCGAVNLAFGDGNVVTYPITELPATIKYVFAKPGTYQVVARGMGNCDGETSVPVRVLGGAPSPAASAPAAPAIERNAAGSPGLDRDRDGMVRRNEWPGDDRSFNAHDWNRDGLLSGDEITEAERAEAVRRATDDRAASSRQAAAAVEKRFTDLDRNGDSRITRDEWNGSRDEFEALDKNTDWVLTRAEMGPTAPTSEAPMGARTVVVQADRSWTDTGIDVRLSDRITFEATGQIRLSRDGSDVAEPRGSSSGRRLAAAPVRQALAGALIARIGDSEPFDVGTRTAPVRAPRDGRLYLGVNDDHTADNRGAFRVQLTVTPAPR
ncbi:MAG: hypothetical protein ABIX28_13335, partial [Vicinamibacterales bacterium]